MTLARQFASDAVVFVRVVVVKWGVWCVRCVGACLCLGVGR